jgi:hypothetical protein
MPINLTDFNKPVVNNDIYEVAAGTSLNFDIVGGTCAVFRRLLPTQSWAKINGADFSAGSYSDRATANAHYKFEFTAPTTVTIGHGATKI